MQLTYKRQLSNPSIYNIYCYYIKIAEYNSEMCDLKVDITLSLDNFMKLIEFIRMSRI